MNKWASVEFSLCRPDLCDEGSGLCRAAKACTRSLLEQEDPYDTPSLLSSKLCCGCSKCAMACPLGAIWIEVS